MVFNTGRLPIATGKAATPAAACQFQGEHTEGYAVNNDEGKLYLIAAHVLKPRALRWKRERQYGYTAECWQRHEEYERYRMVLNLWRSIDSVFTAERDRQAYQSLSLKTRTRYEKILSLPRPLTEEEHLEALAVVKVWGERAGRCE